MLISPIMPSAVSRVASLQAKETGQTPAERNRALFDMINELHEQARVADLGQVKAWLDAQLDAQPKSH